MMSDMMIRVFSVVVDGGQAVGAMPPATSEPAFAARDRGGELRGGLVGVVCQAQEAAWGGGVVGGAHEGGGPFRSGRRDRSC